MQMPATQRPYPPFSLRWSWTVATCLTVAAVAFGFLALPDPRDLIAAGSALGGWLNAGGLRDVLHPLGIWAPAGYLLVQAAQVLVPFLPSAPVTFAGVLLFGWQVGLALSMAGFMVGSALQFAAVRRWGRPLVVRLAGDVMVARSADRLDPGGWWLLAAFLVPFAPADAFSALAALSPISFRRYLLVSFLGRLPWAAGTVLLAAGLISGSVATWVAAGLALVVIATVGIAYRLRSGRAVDPRAVPVSAPHCANSLCRLRCPHRPVS